MYLTAGHGGHYKVPKCSEVKLDAITTDDTGKTYFFAGKVVYTFCLCTDSTKRYNI